MNTNSKKVLVLHLHKVLWLQGIKGSKVLVATARQVNLQTSANILMFIACLGLSVHMYVFFTMSTSLVLTLLFLLYLRKMTDIFIKDISR